MAQVYKLRLIMHSRLIALLVGLVAVCTVAGFSSPGQSKGAGVSAPDDVRQIDLEGLKKLLHRDAKDTRPLLVNFWATWCDPCRDEFPDLVKVDEDYRGKGLNFVAVSLDDVTDIKSAVPKFLKEMKATMRVVLLNVNDPEPAIKLIDATGTANCRRRFSTTKKAKLFLDISAASNPTNCEPPLTKK